MALHHLKLIGQCAWFGVKKTDPRGPINKILPRAVMITSAIALVDDFIGLTRNIEKIAERRKILFGERSNFNL